MSEIRNFLRLKVAEVLGTTPGLVNPDEEFMSLGLDSMHAIFLLDEIEKQYNLEINPHSFWEHPTINLFAADLEKQIKI